MDASVAFHDAQPGSPVVRGFLHAPEESWRDGLVLTHGAGANCNAPLLVSLANTFAERGLTVLRIDLPFRQMRPHGPPVRGSAERDQQGLKRAVDLMRPRVSGRVFVGGHSYGGRQASLLAAADPGIADGLLLLSYPLHPPKRLDQMRTAHFPSLRTPALFVHGTRDGFGTIEEMETNLKLISGDVRLVPVDGAGHELLSRRTQEHLPRAVVDAFVQFFGLA